MKTRLTFPLIALVTASLGCAFLNPATPPASSPSSAAPPAFVEPTSAPGAPLPQYFAAHTSRIERDVTYCTAGGVDLKLDLYFPRAVSGPTALVVFVHGGGWSTGDKGGGSGVLLDTPALLDAGFIVGSLNYRLAPAYQFPAMIEDVKCAIRSLRAHAADYNLNPDRIGVWGGSAGGHLVSLLGTSDPAAGFDVGQYPDLSSRVQAVVDLFGPADLTLGFSDAYLNLRDSVFGSFDLAKASPVTYITPDDPPFLILQGDRDTTVPLSQSQEFYDKLTAAGVDAQLVIVKGGPHGLGAPNESPSREELTKMIVDFFEKNLK